MTTDLDVLDKEFKANIHPRVFWDCRFEDLSLKKNKYFMIARTLMRGTDKEIHFIESLFSLDDILKAVERSPEVDAVCRNYYRYIYDYVTKRQQSHRRASKKTA